MTGLVDQPDQMTGMRTCGFRDCDTSVLMSQMCHFFYPGPKTSSTKLCKFCSKSDLFSLNVNGGLFVTACGGNILLLLYWGNPRTIILVLDLGSVWVYVRSVM